MDAPGHWFHHRPSDRLSLDDVPASIRPTLPEGFVDHAHTVARKLGITSDMGYAEVLRTLVFWFRSFAPGELPAGSGDTYLDLALGRKGVCRHRAYAFVITAHGLGIPARYVSNEAHVFVEVFVPRTGWMRIDLGGGASGMNVRNSNQKTRHQVAGNDPFGFPPGFRDGYSQGALQGRPEDAATGDPVRGLPPIPGHPGAGTGAGGAAATGAATGPFSRFFGTPKVIPFAESRGQKDTRTTLEAVSARVFRGDKLSVQGVVVTEGGNPVVGGRVRINLVDPGRDAIVRVLGNTRTDEAGTFAASVTVPTEVELGTWEVIAEFVGNAQLAPSRSE